MQEALGARCEAGQENTHSLRDHWSFNYFWMHLWCGAYPQRGLEIAWNVYVGDILEQIGIAPLAEILGKTCISKKKNITVSQGGRTKDLRRIWLKGTLTR